ncbi:branched-chain amino acid ABC transporter permease [Acidovorax delafieldii]|uniref:branched-chain amino acid ABC transporter permease n=1 Tax=Acidovorax delafieldii TaxID=47920 RepID=UPI003ECDB486
MELFIQQLVAGISTGTIYACVALAVVMIYQAIGHVNFAQGEMAMLSAFLAWQLLEFGIPYWLVFPVTVVGSFVLGMVLERTLMRPLRNAPPLSQVIVFIGLLLVINSVAGYVWSFTVKAFPTPFGTGPFMGSVWVSRHQAGMMATTLALLVLLYLFFRFSKVGLAMRGAANNAGSARLLGIRVKALEGLGWGMAAAIGSVAGMLIAPVVFLEPNMMAGVLIYGFAGAVLGGLSSPTGAVLGGILVGVLENLAGTFIPGIGGELKLTLALVMIVLVLVVRPQGLLGRKLVSRV